jgi:hypothetical protein
MLCATSLCILEDKGNWNGIVSGSAKIGSPEQPSQGCGSLRGPPACGPTDDDPLRPPD